MDVSSPLFTFAIMSAIVIVLSGWLCGDLKAVRNMVIVACVMAVCGAAIEHYYGNNRWGMVNMTLVGMFLFALYSVLTAAVSLYKSGKYNGME